MSRDEQGSRWHRWDPHIHAPGTALSDQFSDSEYEAYLSALETTTPRIDAVGVTDYLSTKCYDKVRSSQEGGRLSNIFLFPNVELRLSIGTKEGHGVNIHFLVSPDDPDHVAEIGRFLARLSFRFGGDDFRCTESDLQRLGRAHKPGGNDDATAYKEGVNQFKVDFNQLRSAYDESTWMRRNALVAVAARSSDGTAGLQDDEASFAAQRKEIEAFAQIIFSATPSVIRFWSGDGVVDAELSRQRTGDSSLVCMGRMLIGWTRSEDRTGTDTPGSRAIPRSTPFGRRA